MQTLGIVPDPTIGSIDKKQDSLLANVSGENKIKHTKDCNKLTMDSCSGNFLEHNQSINNFFRDNLNAYLRIYMLLFYIFLSQASHRQACFHDWPLGYFILGAIFLAL